MTVPYWTIKKQNHPKYDFIIIGGGISGVSTAYWLRKKYQNASILLLEKNQVCSGASGRNAGFISTGSLALFEQKVNQFGLNKAIEIRKFYQENHRLLKQEIIQNNETDFDYKLCGSVTLSTKNGFYASVLNSNGFEIEQVTKKQISSQGLLNFNDGFLDKGDASVNSFKLVSKILDKAKIAVLENCEVYKIGDNSVATNFGEISAETIISCLNGYSSTLGDSKIDPIRGQMMVVEAKNNLTNNFYSPDHLCYFRPINKDSILIGGFRKLEEKTEVGYSDHFVTPIIQDAFYSFLKTNIDTNEIKINHQWAGIMGFTPDHMPLLGKTGKNTYFIGGYSGHGMGQSFHCAKVLVDLIVDQKEVPEFLNINRNFLSK